MLQPRSIPLCIVLSIVTCGLYSLYWFAKITDEVSVVTGQGGTSGALAVVFNLLTCGIYGYYWGWTTGQKLNSLHAKWGNTDNSLHILFLVLNIFGLMIVTLALAQDELNRAINA